MPAPRVNHQYFRNTALTALLAEGMDYIEALELESELDIMATEAAERMKRKREQRND